MGRRRNDTIHARESRNPNRTDGVRWNCNAFICPASVDGFKMNIRDTKAAVGPMDDFSPPVLDDEFTKEAPRIHEVAILDIARRAKPKGIARDFEVLRAPRHVIAMEDFTHEGLHFPDEESEWEDINDFDSLWEDNTEIPDNVWLREHDEPIGSGRHAKQKLAPSGTRRKAYSDVLRGDGRQ